GERLNRRHRPGRAFERTSYRFDILGDYGAFRDLQRHRLLTLEWQRLTPRHGSVMPETVAEAGAAGDWRRVLTESAELHDAIAVAGLPEVASYAVAMAYRVRFYMEMNAREAMHVIELRTTPQGHPAYRRIAQAMHRLIAERAGHRAIAAAMTFADHSAVELARFVRGPHAPARPHHRLPPVGGGGARVLDRVCRVLGRDDARPAAARDQRRPLRADAPADRHADRPGDPRRNVPSGRSLAGGRRDPRPRGRRLAPAH